MLTMKVFHCFFVSFAEQIILFVIYSLLNQQCLNVHSEQKLFFYIFMREKIFQEEQNKFHKSAFYLKSGLNLDYKH